MFSCAVWTLCRRVWSFVDVMTFTVFKEIWLSLYILYIFSWHSWFTVATFARCFAFATNFFSSSWWVMTKVDSFNLLFSSQFIFIMIAVISSLLLLSSSFAWMFLSFTFASAVKLSCAALIFDLFWVSSCYEFNALSSQ